MTWNNIFHREKPRYHEDDDFHKTLRVRDLEFRIVLMARTPLPLPHAAENLLPHRPPMMLIDRLLTCGEDRSGSAEVKLHADCVLVDGTLNRVALVEMMAQTYAAINGYEDISQGKPVKEGFLVGIRKSRFLAEARVGDRLTIDVANIGTMDGFHMIRASVRRDETILAEGTLKLWVPGESSAAQGQA
jgi:3-hydroxyacyl-[acyl-carrier-protein] dehydratase